MRRLCLTPILLRQARFSLYLAMLFLYFAGNWGFVSQYLLPAAPALANPWPGISGLLAIATGNCFYKHLFGIDHHHPVLLWLYRALSWITLAAIPLIPLGYQPEVMPIIIQLTLLMTLVGLWLSYRRWRQREAGGVLVFLANLISLGNILVILLTVLGWIPTGLWQFYSVNLAVLGVILTLHLSLGYRHRAQREAQRLALAEVARERQVREQQGRFIDLLSHECRTPLAVLQTIPSPADRHNQRILTLGGLTGLLTASSGCLLIFRSQASNDANGCSFFSEMPPNNPQITQPVLREFSPLLVQTAKPAQPGSINLNAAIDSRKDAKNGDKTKL